MKKIVALSLCAIIGIAPSVCLAEVSTSAILALTNGDRTSNGVPPLFENPLLDKTAQMKADDMASRGYYSHLTPEGYSPLYWLDKAGYKYRNMGENIFLSSVSIATDQVANDAWMNSSGHRANILSPQFTEIGIGVANGIYQGQEVIFVVQEFGTPFVPPAPVPVVSKQTLASAETPSPLSATQSPTTTTISAIATTSQKKTRISFTQATTSKTGVARKVSVNVLEIQTHAYATTSPVSVATSSAIATSTITEAVPASGLASTSEHREIQQSKTGFAQVIMTVIAFLNKILRELFMDIKMSVVF